MAKEGIPVILVLILISAILIIGAIVTPGILMKIFVGISWFLILFSVYFFRDPQRQIPAGDNIILSPADGKVIVIEEVDDQDFFKTRVKKISIFMSVFNVHVNRIPIDGRVTYFNYQKGKFHPAFKDDASYENEQTTIVIENEGTKILFKQIAGVVARRIVCHIREGWSVKQGERFGMIRFGSRLDIMLPLNVDLNVKLSQKVTAGETIIGYYSRQ